MISSRVPTWLFGVAILAVVTALEALTRAESTFWVAGGMVAGAVLLSQFGLVVARRLLSQELLEQHGGIVNTIYQVIGTIYAVMLAFAIIVVWESFAEAQATVSREANALADLERLSRGFPMPVRRQVMEAARTYAQVVIEDEWPAMMSRQSSPRAYAALVEMWGVYTDMRPAERGLPLYAQSLQLIETLDDSRRKRLLASTEDVPTLMWLLLKTGALLTLALAYLLPSRNRIMQAILLGSLAGVIGLALFLVGSFEGPFRGALHVQPQAFELVLKLMPSRS